MSDPIFNLFLVCIYLIPVGLIAGSKRTAKNEKNVWLICAIFFSWAVLLLYYLVVPSVRERKKSAINKAKSKHAKLKAKIEKQNQAKEGVIGVADIADEHAGEVSVEDAIATVEGGQADTAQPDDKKPT
ncbi:hypothetical protein [Flocculibacter collagenilyticus]|uniref:hypothetical protein n=1 Tax=Flocculibacter collagenilyticus TaxID=2744479 RepID=UPI0018F62510|nr:hypothetical protein [Flocculibacter collagenilyticus]